MKWERSQLKFGKTPVPETPYQKAKQVVDNRLGSALTRGKNWRLAFFGQTALCASLAGGLIWQGAQATIVPWVVEVDETSGVKASGPAQTNFKPSDAQIANQLARFIKNVRSVSIDPVVLRDNWMNAYNYATIRPRLRLTAMLMSMTLSQILDSAASQLMSFQLFAHPPIALKFVGERQISETGRS